MKKNTKEVTIYMEIANERCKQTLTWGTQRHDMPVWCMILGEEVGEVQKAALECFQAEEKNKTSKAYKKMVEYRAELIQVAAVAVAAIESLDAMRIEDV